MLRRLRLVLIAWLLATVAAFAQISVEQEIALGQQAAARMEQRYGVVNDPNMTNRLANIGMRIVSVSGRPELPWTFRIINMPEWNAMAFPGGPVYATPSLMQSLPDEQLAFVIGHEIAHVVKRHSIRQIGAEQMRQMGLMAILLGVSRGGQLPAGSQVLAGLLDRIMSSQYSQADEDDADRNGIIYMAQAGYDPVYAIAALHNLRAQSGDRSGFLADHPAPKTRLERAYQFVMNVPFTQPAVPALINRPQPIPQPAPVRTGPARIDPEWEARLNRVVQLAGVPVTQDTALRNRARQQVAQMRSDTNGVMFQMPAGATIAQAESRLLSQELPRLIRRGVRAIGISSLQRGDGSHMVLVLTR